MALFHDNYLDAIVALGVKINNQISWTGTGFLVGKSYVKSSNEQDFHILLVTNKHVLSNNTEMFIRFNTLHGGSADFPLLIKDITGKDMWTGHPNPQIDLAITYIDKNFLTSNNLKYTIFDIHNSAINVDQMKLNHITEGALIHFFGFPLSLLPPDRQYPIVRLGSIARIRDLYDNKSEDFLIDGLVYPGSSGGPVITRPEICSIEGTLPVDKTFLIGIIKGYIPFTDIAISVHTGKERIRFEDNSGLAPVIPASYLLDLVELWFSLLNSGFVQET